MLFLEEKAISSIGRGQENQVNDLPIPRFKAGRRSRARTSLSSGRTNLPCDSTARRDEISWASARRGLFRQGIIENELKE